MAEFFDPRIDILPAQQKLLWEELRPARALGLTLYGGTAIALHLGHRTSVDFDFFSSKSLDPDEVRMAFPFLQRKKVQELQREMNTYTVLTESNVKISFFGGISFGRIGSPKVSRDGVAQIASLDDLLATKVKVILQRVEAKDYIDIAAMIQAGVHLPKALAAARLFYGSNFAASESLRAMTYFEGGDLKTLSKKTKAILVSAADSVQELPKFKLLSKDLSLP